MSDQGTPKPAAALPYAPGAIASLVLGIIGTTLGWCYAVGLIPSIIGLVFGIKARKAIEANPSAYQSPGLATAGFVLSIVGLATSAIGILIIILAIVALASAASVNPGIFFR